MIVSDRLISTAAAARIWRVAVPTFRGYVSKGYAPMPVAPSLYSETEVREALAARAGKGARTDRW